MSPTLQRGEHHEQVGGSITLIFIVFRVARLPSRMPRLPEDRRACFGDKFSYRSFRPGRPKGILGRAVSDTSTSFMLAKKAALAIRRDDPLLLQARLEDVCFCVRPIVLSLAAIDDLQFGDLLFQQLQRPPLATTLARFETGQGDQFGFGALRQRCAFWPRADECLRTRTALNPSSIGCWLVRRHPYRRWYRGSAAIWQSLHPSSASRSASAFNSVYVLLVSCRAGCFTGWPSSRQSVSRSRIISVVKLGSRTVSDWRRWLGDHGCLGGWGTNSRCLFWKPTRSGESSILRLSKAGALSSPIEEA